MLQNVQKQRVSYTGDFCKCLAGLCPQCIPQGKNTPLTLKKSAGVALGHQRAVCVVQAVPFCLPAVKQSIPSDLSLLMTFHDYVTFSQLVFISSQNCIYPAHAHSNTYYRQKFPVSSAERSHSRRRAPSTPVTVHGSPASPILITVRHGQPLPPGHSRYLRYRPCHSRSPREKPESTGEGASCPRSTTTRIVPRVRRPQVTCRS